MGTYEASCFEMLDFFTGQAELRAARQVVSRCVRAWGKRHNRVDIGLRLGC